MAVAACRFAIVHNLHEVPPVPGHLSRQDNHSLHKWAASTLSAGRPRVGRANPADHPSRPTPSRYVTVGRYVKGVPCPAQRIASPTHHDTGVREPNTP